MDHAYAIKKLTLFLIDVNSHLAVLDEWSESHRWPPVSDELLLQEVEARRIEDAYQPGLGDYRFDHDGHEQDHWVAARQAAIDALGRARSADEYAAFLRPTSPNIAADDLHPWVWQPAAPLWAADAHQDAVLAAARTVNRRLQQKLNRHDIGEYDLAMQSFDPKAPVVGKPRLRAPGDRTTPTWRARQEGAKYVTAGVFLAIRNIAAHDDDADWSEQEALEYLATLSVVARWIEEFTVETSS